MNFTETKKKYGTVASTSNIESLLDNDKSENSVKFNRSLSDDFATNNLNSKDRGRHVLYKNLPFISISGMQFREKTIARRLSRSSFDETVNLGESNTFISELEVDQVVFTMPLLSAVFVAVTLMFLSGFNTGVMNSLGKYVFPGHSLTEWSLAVAAFAVGGPFGATLAGKISNQKGRRFAVITNMWLFLVGGLVLMFATSIYLIIFGRFITGFSSGYASVIVPIYLGELAPPTIRGMLGTLTQFSLVIGILASNLLSFPLAGIDGWRYLLGITALLALLEIFASPFIVESPRWLLSGNNDDNINEASLIIKRLRNFQSEEEVQKEINHIQQASLTQRIKGQTSAHGSGAVKDLLFDKRVRILVISFAILHASQQLSGINAVFYYSTSFFEGIVSDPLLGTALVGGVNVIATYIALLLMDRTGRVSLMLWSSGGMLVSCGIITLALFELVPNTMALVGVMLFVTFFELGLGPIPWLIVAEMFDAKYVATAMAVACQINWLFNFVVGVSFPTMASVLGIWVFAPFAFVLLCTFLFCFYFLPETAGRSHSEIEKIINTKNDMSDLTFIIEAEPLNN